MMQEIEKSGLAQHELLVSYLKIFLILTVRISNSSGITKKIEENSRPDILQKLINKIEKYYKEKHSASDYADSLNISPNALV